MIFTQKNKKIPESFNQKFREWWCKQFGHIKIGPYYRMPQTYCRRCGAKNKSICNTEAEDYDNDIWGPFFE